MSVLDKNWRYRDAHETSTPGYLKRRFAEIRKAQERERQERAEAEVRTAAKIKPIKVKS